MLKIIAFSLLFIASGAIRADALSDAKEALTAENYPAAYKLLLPLAKNGNAESQLLLGWIYSGGLGVAQDKKQAYLWYRKAAERGDPQAIYMLGIMYERGDGVAKNEAEAAYWYQKGADKGHVDSQVSLAKSYYNGTGVAQDHEKAFSLFKRAADQGNVYAQKTLGGLYYSGMGVAQNYREAMTWFRKAVEQGDRQSEEMLVVMYENGQGVPKDSVAADQWRRKIADKNSENIRDYRSKAEKGDPGFQYILGSAYQEGTMVPQNLKEAAAWYRKAAEGGSPIAPLAQEKLGLMYLLGQGVPQDNKEASVWLKKAADQGYERAREALLSIPDTNSLQLADFLDGTAIAWAFVDRVGVGANSTTDCDQTFESESGIIRLYENSGAHYIQTVAWAAATDTRIRRSSPIAIDPYAGNSEKGEILSSTLKNGVLIQDIRSPETGIVRRIRFADENPEDNQIIFEGWEYLNPTEAEKREYEYMRKNGWVEPMPLSLCSRRSYERYVQKRNVAAMKLAERLEIRSALEYVLEKKWSHGSTGCEVNGGGFRVYSRRSPMGVEIYAWGKLIQSLGGGAEAEHVFKDSGKKEFILTRKIYMDNRSAVHSESIQRFKLISPSRLEIEITERKMNMQSMMRGERKYDNKVSKDFAVLCEEAQ